MQLLMATKYVTESMSYEQLDSIFWSVKKLQPPDVWHTCTSPDARSALQQYLSKAWFHLKLADALGVVSVKCIRYCMVVQWDEPGTLWSLGDVVVTKRCLGDLNFLFGASFWLLAFFFVISLTDVILVIKVWNHKQEVDVFCFFFPK